MDAEAVGRQWNALAHDAFTGMREWRLTHPRATLSEIEAALDARLSCMRACMLEDLALASAATELHTLPADARPVCPSCGAPLQARGLERRTLTTHGEQSLTLRHTRAVCPACGTGLFPPG